jgi:hypothetical protein
VLRVQDLPCHYQPVILRLEKIVVLVVYEVVHVVPGARVVCGSLVIVSVVLVEVVVALVAAQGGKGKQLLVAHVDVGDDLLEVPFKLELGGPPALPLLLPLLRNAELPLALLPCRLPHRLLLGRLHGGD